MSQENKKIPVLFAQKQDCCGCGACVNICNKNAIEMKEDECGYLYPVINPDLCIGCGVCKRVCAFQNTQVTQKPVKTYAGVTKNKIIQADSASGGVFATIARYILQNGGVVCGAAFHEDWNVQHTIISSETELHKLQGSKYTHSNIKQTYKEAKQFLQEGKLVLFSGTPCQIAGLYGYLNHNYDNLITTDIICHGVPSNRMLKDYIRMLEKKEHSKVKMFSFRDKTIGWGINGSICFSNGKKVILWQSSSSYFYYFVKGWIYRENCYKCKYASMHRPADLTLGDYWGIEKVHPDYLGKSGWDETKGISVVIANNEKGVKILDQVKEYIELRESSFEYAAAYNGQLNQPCNSGNRDQLVHLYKRDGWEAVEVRFLKKIGWRKYTSQIKALLPAPVKRILKGFR